MSCDQNKNPLQRGGTSQRQRVLNAIKKDYILIDERDYVDWIVFAREFAAYLHYYDKTDTVSGNWKAFFEHDISTILGTIAIQRIDGYRLVVSERFAILKGNESASNITSKREALGDLFAAILTLCQALDQQMMILQDSIPLKNTLLNLIQSKLQASLYKLLTYYKGGKALGLIKERDHTAWKILGLPVLKASTQITQGLSKPWIGMAPSWSDYYLAIDGNESIYGDPLLNNHRKMNHIANHNLFSGLFGQFLRAYSKIITEAEKGLLQTLYVWKEHAPHYALFLSFLKLFRPLRDQANTLTQRHLDFYYKEVLQLLPKKAMPNKVHVVVELAKQVDSYLLPKGTLWKAGKDSAGKEVNYALTDNVVFNRAKIAHLSAVYRGTDKDNVEGAVINEGRLFAAAISNAADGNGAALESPSKGWHPFVNKQYTEGKLKAVQMPKALIGFALASHYLYLTEGKRLVNIKFAPAFTMAQVDGLMKADCYLTSEKGWVHISSFNWSSGVISGTGIAASVLSFTLESDIPAIINYQSAVHEGNFRTDLPLFKMILKNDDTRAYTYETLKQLTISKIEIEVKVGLNASDVINGEGLKNLSISNDIGVLNPSKPFFPFGPAPKTGASFLIGNEELFKKKNAHISVLIKWKDWIIASDYPKGNLHTLKKGGWDTTLASGWNLFAEENFSSGIPLPLPETTIVDYRAPYAPFDISTVNGFIKLSLDGDFGHNAYQKKLTTYYIKLANDVKDEAGNGPVEPPEPYTPYIEKMAIHYKASSVIDWNDMGSYNQRAVHFFHVFPFGEAEQYRKLSDVYVKLLPQFTHPKDSGVYNEGEFYIGFEHLIPGQSVHVLFQLLEGTTNPQLEKPKDHVTWSYLHQDHWTALTDKEVNDRTDQLIRSGLISFMIPSDATTDHTILPAGYIWLRASVAEKAEAVCKLLDIVAQAALLAFQPQGNADDFLDHILPPGTISKLKIPTSSIKKIMQPYTSFEGRINETAEAYYVRVSERLRHKSRAITIWDYEHLVLEAFPEIHKVKCLNHTKYEGTDYNEVAPGHVTLITIPNLLHRNDTNPLRPYTRVDVLKAIYDFLRKKISCHVTLHVRQPQFEEVRLDFKLKLMTGLAFNDYHQLLQQEITSFLTPWAYDEVADITFGGKIHKSALINFIEERAYVDYVTEVKMYHRIEENAAAESGDSDVIEASTAKSILVSAAAGKHVITEIITIPEMAETRGCTDAYNTQH